VAAIPDVEIVGDPDDRLPHIVTFSALYADGESLVRELDRRGLALASGSACTSSTLEPSHVLAAMGALTHGNVRLTLPWEAAVPERQGGIERLIAHLPEVVAGVRAQLGAQGL
ncbi:MAG: aminotransferase class V-fold PLP-dependent enzyme, partial [Nostocoides sp.]